MDCMIKKVSIPLGKGIKKIAALRGGGSALPGLVIEKLDPDFLERTLSQLPQGVVVISGTNGKTTTTKMVVELLESQGLRVFTNRTGSNFVRGVVAALLGDVDSNGQLNADIAVLELDEAHAVHFVKKVSPRYSLLLNVMRDQLDRFGEIDHTANLLRQIAAATTDNIVVNREDPRLLKLARELDTSAEVTYFGLSEKTRALFPDDDSMRSSQGTNAKLPVAAVELDSIAGENNATFKFLGQLKNTDLALNGLYNIYNSAAALALVQAICEESLDTEKLFLSLKNVQPAFGRGEKLTLNGRPLELVLVKNPSGFRLGLSSFSPDGYATMIAINDNYADGRDMSWLWDVEFDSLKPHGVDAVSGVRAYDMALRLQYDDVEVRQVSTDLDASLEQFVERHSAMPKRIYCTYTAMLSIRRQLAKITDVEKVS